MNPFKSFLGIREDKPKKKTNTEKNSLIQNIIVKTISRVVKPVTYGRDSFVGSEYNLSEIKEAIDTDSYIKIATLKYSCLIFKSGWKLKADNQKAIDYILKRFKYMSLCTGVPIEILFQEIGDDLYKYSNAFLIKTRVDNIPGIKASPVFNKKIVGGYFRADPSTIKIKRDKHGKILKYEQSAGLEKVEFDPDDVIHMYMDKDANNAFGTPRITAALDDVKLLRKIEGNIVALIHRFSMPIYHWKIGALTPGFQGTDPEINKAKREWEASTLDGAFITNEKHEIKAIGAEGTAINAEPYLNYFEQRVFSALGVSSAQMGRSGAKQDADSMEAQVHDTVKYVQRILSIFIENMMIMELLLEGGFDVFDRKNDVKFKFEEISLETKLKKENHELTKYQSNMISFEEARRNIGIKDEVEDEDKLYQNFIATNARLKEIDRTAKHRMDLEKFKVKTAESINNNNADSNKNNNENTKGGNAQKKNQSTSGKKPRTSKDNSPNGTADSINKPKNQYGTHSVKVKESLQISKKTKKQFNDVFKIYEELRNGIDVNKDNTMLLKMAESSLNELLNKYYDNYSVKGLFDATNEINKVYKDEYRLVPNINNNSKAKDSIQKTLSSLFKDIKKGIKNNNSVDVIDIYEYRLRFLVDYTTRSAYWYSYAMAGKILGIEKAYLILSEDDSEGREKELNLSNFTEEDIPAFHPFCSCRITYSKKKAGE